MSRNARTRLATALVLVAVFGAGVLVGFATEGSAMAEVTDLVPENEAGDSAEAEAPARRARIYDQVGPNERQLELIDSIVQVHRARTTELDEEHRAQLNAGFRDILLETREAIKGVFTEEQAAEYQRLLDERDARAAARENEDERD